MIALIQHNRSHPIIGMLVIPIIALCIVSQLYLFLPIQAELGVMLHKELPAVGLLTTLFGFFYALGFMVWGPISDRYGRNRIILLGLTLLALVTATIPLTNHYTYLVIARSLQGFLAASFPPVALAWLVENLPAERKTLAISLISLAFLLSSTLGQLYGVITMHGSLLYTMGLLAIVYFLGAVIFYQATCHDNPQRPTRTRSTLSVKRLLSAVLSTLCDKALSRIYFCASFVLMSFVTLYVLLNTLAGDQYPSNDANLLRGIATVAMLLCLTSGRLYRHMEPRRVLCLAVLCMALSLFVQYEIMIGPFYSLLLLMSCHFLFAAGVALAIPSMITCVNMFSKNENRGLALSLYTCILFIGASLGSLLPTLISTRIVVPLIIFLLLFSSCYLFFFKATTPAPGKQK